MDTALRTLQEEVDAQNRATGGRPTDDFSTDSTFASAVGSTARYDLVQSLKHSHTTVSDAELEYAVRLFEKGEATLARSRFAPALELFVELCTRFPNFASGHLKMGMARVGVNAEAGNVDRDESYLDSFQKALALEPNNVGMRSFVDFVLKMVSSVPIEDGEFDLAFFPKTGGDLAVLDVLV